MSNDLLTAKLSLAAAVLAFLSVSVPIVRPAVKAAMNMADKSRLRHILLWMLALIFFYLSWAADRWMGNSLAGLLLLFAYYGTAMTAFAKLPEPALRMEILWCAIIPSVNFVYLAIDMQLRGYFAVGK